jgi:hypothetical protein
MPEPAQDVVNTLFKPLFSLSQALSQAVPQFEQMAPHVVLEKLRLSLTTPKAAPPPPPPVEQRMPFSTHQKTNVGLYKQSQTVGKRARVGVLDEAGYMTGLGNIAFTRPSAPASETLSQQPARMPTEVGLANIAATNPKGMTVEQIYPVTEAQNQFTLYAPAQKKVKIETPLF